MDPCLKDSNWREEQDKAAASPTLFALRQDSTITGINIDGNEHVISVFVDDVLIYLNDTINLSHLMKILEWLGLHWGYNLNLHKSQLLTLNC